MTKIFTNLALFGIGMVVANLLIGLSMGDLNVESSQAVKNWASVHRVFGVLAGCAVVLVNSIVVTYFIGTSRWVREVVETYDLDFALVQEANRIKRKAFPWAVSSMLAVVAMIALGGACDPGNGWGVAVAKSWAIYHYVAAFVVLGYLALASMQEWNKVHANGELVDRVMADVARIRAENGLDTKMTNDQAPMTN